MSYLHVSSDSTIELYQVMMLWSPPPPPPLPKKTLHQCMANKLDPNKVTVMVCVGV